MVELCWGQHWTLNFWTLILCMWPAWFRVPVFVTATIDTQKLMAGSLGVYSKAVVCGVPESLPAAALRTCDSGEPVNLQKAREQHDQYVKVYRSIRISVYQVLLPEVHWYHAVRCWGSWCRKCTWCQWMSAILTACLWRTLSLCVMEQPSLPFQVGSSLIHHWCSVLHSIPPSSLPFPFHSREVFVYIHWHLLSSWGAVFLSVYVWPASLVVGMGCSIRKQRAFLYSLQSSHIFFFHIITYWTRHKVSNISEIPVAACPSFSCTVPLCSYRANIVAPTDWLYIHSLHFVVIFNSPPPPFIRFTLWLCCQEHCIMSSWCPRNHDNTLYLLVTKAIPFFPLVTMQAVCYCSSSNFPKQGQLSELLLYRQH